MEKGTKQILLQAMEANLREAYEHLGKALGGEFQREVGLTCFFTGSTVPLCNGVTHFHVPAQEADARIEAITHTARNRRLPMTWLLGPSRSPEDLEERLVAHGWREDEQVPGMAVELDRSEAVKGAVSPDFAVSEITDGEMMQAWLRVLCAGFGFPEPVRNVFFGLYNSYGFVPHQSPTSPRYLLGSLRGEPVGTALLTFGGNLAGIYGVATLPQVRRQGIGTAMTLACMRLAQDLGYRTATLQATPMGLPVYRRLGWQHHCMFKTYKFLPETC